MIDRFEIAQAVRYHVLQMADPAAVLDSLQVVDLAFQELVAAMLKARMPADCAKSKELAYHGGFVDGFVLGVKAQCAESVALCERCGDGISRLGDDPVPEDFDPMTMTLLCHSCAVGAQASMN